MSLRAEIEFLRRAYRTRCNGEGYMESREAGEVTLLIECVEKLVKFEDKFEDKYGESSV